ncbi:MAG: undecaprenyldiphospho-muramoylpentapeptide beta-N-acetylglucosaminyltransferase [Pseudomonadota bacterium]
MSDTSTQGPILLAAGGTGGHLFPAQALATVLRARGHTVHLMTDDRGDRYGMTFPADEIHLVKADTIRGRNPLALARTFFKLGRGFFQARGVLKRIKPSVVVGFGGYPTLPPIFAAKFLGIPAILHEQNAVMGRANRLLAPRVKKIATSFPKVRNLSPEDAEKCVQVGIPVREPVIAARETPYVTPQADGPFELLVFGGSQGARILSDVVPGAVARFDAERRARLRVTQQCREEDLDRVRFAYDAVDVKADLQPFFPDLPTRMARAHLVISRSGASTVAELGVIGRPSVLVPLPHALDNDQLMNAAALSSEGGAKMLQQQAMTPHTLADLLAELMDAPNRLTDMAAKARGFGNPHAADALADLVETLLPPAA